MNRIDLRRRTKYFTQQHDSTFGILSYRPRKRVRQLARECNILYGSTENTRKLPRCNAILNWGSSDPSGLSPGVWINHPNKVAIAVNKLRTFVKLSKANVPCVPWTEDEDGTKEWKNIVYRQLLESSKGKGIVIIKNKESPPPGHWKLATKYLVKAREFRVHATPDHILCYSQKKRRNGHKDNEEFDPLIKNSDNGWVYTFDNVRRIDAVEELAMSAIHTLELDFGAVDIIVHQDKPYVLEVNTAPGITSNTAHLAYIAYINSWRT